MHCPDVQKVVVEIVGDLGDDLRLPHAARAPDVQGHTFADQRVKRLIEFRWFHELSSNGLNCAELRFRSSTTTGWNLVILWIGYVPGPCDFDSRWTG